MFNLLLTLLTALGIGLPTGRGDRVRVVPRNERDQEPTGVVSAISIEPREKEAPFYMIVGDSIAVGVESWFSKQATTLPSFKFIAKTRVGAGSAQVHEFLAEALAILYARMRGLAGQEVRVIISTGISNSVVDFNSVMGDIIDTMRSSSFLDGHNVTLYILPVSAGIYKQRGIHDQRLPIFRRTRDGVHPAAYSGNLPVVRLSGVDFGLIREQLLGDLLWSADLVHQDQSDLNEWTSERPHLIKLEGGRYTSSDPVESVVIAIESGGNPRAVNASGTCEGLFQFDVSTWKRYGYGGPDMRRDPDVSAQAWRSFRHDIERVLRSAGLDVNPSTVYITHNQGLTGGPFIIKQAEKNPDASVPELVVIQGYRVALMKHMRANYPGRGWDGKYGSWVAAWERKIVGLNKG